MITLARDCKQFSHMYSKPYVNRPLKNRQNKNLNPYKPMNFQPLTKCTSPFPLAVFLLFFSNFNKTSCKRTVENLIRRSNRRRLVLFSTVCRCPIKKGARLLWVNDKLLLNKGRKDCRLRSPWSILQFF